MNDRPGRAGRTGWLRALEWLALLAAVTLAAALSWRKITSVDIGYHLAYGDYFLQHGRIVDSNLFVYTRIDPAEVKEPGPGTWFDEQGRYRFPNPSYASEILFSLVHRLAGPVGLCVLQTLLVVALLTLMGFTMRRLGVPMAWAAAGLTLAALISHERFLHRPEMLGYVCLAAQLLLLSSPRPGKLTAAGLVLTQWIFVQFHATWILGLALTAALTAGAALRLLWRVVPKPAGRRRKPSRKQVGGELTEPEPRRRLKWLGLVLAGQLVVIFINPWFWRIPALPAQMIMYFRRHHIAGWAGRGSGHPWAGVGEMFRTFAGQFHGLGATYAFMALLALTALAGIVALWRRRWGELIVLGGFTLVGLNIRRNMAPAAVVLVPVGLGLLALGTRQLAGRKLSWLDGIARPAGAVLTVILASWWTIGVVANRLYHAERRIWRFGAGYCEVELPLDAGALCRELPAGVNVFTTYSAGSNVLYFGRSERGFRPVPLLTNSWAFPPEVMDRLERMCQARPGSAEARAFERFVKDYHVGAVVLESSRHTAPLMGLLSRQADWAVGQVRPNFVVFLKRTGPTAALARRHELHQSHPAVGRLIERYSPGGPIQALTLGKLAWTFQRLGWLDAAVRAWRAAVRRDHRYHEGFNNLGVCLAMRGTARALRMKRLLEANRLAEAEKLRLGALADWRAAGEAFEKSLRLRPERPTTREHLELLHRQVSEFQRGVILVPGWTARQGQGNLPARP